MGDHGTWPTVGDATDIAFRLLPHLSCNSYMPPPATSKTQDQSHTDADLRCARCDKGKTSHVDSTEYAQSFPELVSRHLIDTDVAVLMEVGSEKLRFVGGIACAINSAGAFVTVDLDDIYAKAREAFSGSVTQASY